MVKRSFPIFSAICVGLLVVVMMLASLPTTSVRADDDFQVHIALTGVLQSWSNGQIVLDDGTVATIDVNTVLPDNLTVGTTVTIVVTVTDNGLVLDSVAVGNATATPTATPNATATAAATGTEAATATAAATSTEEATEAEGTADANCLADTSQPVAQRLADAFNVPYSEIMGWHCKGYGFGEIAKAYLLAKLSGKNGGTAMSVADIFALKASGMGWGQIVKKLGVSPSDLAPGQAIKGNNGKGNNGHGKGKGKGNGKGNGNGNGDGNGDDQGGD